MKKYILLLISILLLDYHAFAACDQVFDGGMLRYNQSYRFYDDWINETNKDVYMNTYNVHFENPSYLDKGSDFGWTQNLISNGYRVNSNSSMRVLQTGVTNRRIAQHPTTRTPGNRHNYDFGIEYNIGYDYANNYPNASDDISHTECIYYSVSWCGDGVFDSGYEQCDPNDTRHTGWGVGGCSITCEPIITVSPTCNNLAITGTSGTIPLTSNFLCNANLATTYRIDVMNSSGTILNTINNSTGSYTFTSTGSYTARCTINGNITSNSCLGNINILSTNTCQNGGVGGSLSSTISSSTPGLCQSGAVLSNFISTVSGRTTTYSWMCDGLSGGNCSATYTRSRGGGGGGGGGSSTGDGGGGSSGSSRCGDGTIGNYEITGEMCDFGTGIWPSWCDRETCTIIENTKPGAYNLKFEPEGDILLGDGMSIFGNLSTSFATFTNNTESDVYIPGHICVYKNNKTYNVITGNNICSSNKIGFVGKNGGVKKVGINNNQFIADTGAIPLGRDYGEAEIITTLEGLQNMDTFLKAVLNVRVAKSSVNTLGGGASLLNGAKFSDVNVLTTGGFSLLKPEYNRNLILSSLGVNPLSSYVKTTSNSNDIALTKEQGSKELSSFDKIENNLNSYSLNRLPSEKFNDLENVYIHKGNVTLGSQNISGADKTFIIEDGNLTINGNLTSTNNILFVVKNGDLIISNNVTNIDAILIDIGGEINGESTSTLNRLTINGAIYGDVGDLLSKRTYIKDRGAYVDVGTNINFTSKIFNSPPPLLSKFLSEYTKVKKIAK